MVALKQVAAGGFQALFEGVVVGSLVGVVRQGPLALARPFHLPLLLLWLLFLHGAA